MFSLTKRSAGITSRLLQMTSKSTYLPSIASIHSSTSYNRSNFSTVSFDPFESIGSTEIESVLFHYSRGDKFWSESQLEKALEEYHEVLKLALRSKNLSFIDLNTVYKNIGHIYLKQRSFHDSIKNYEKALSIVSTDFGEKHFQVGYTFRLIAAAYIQQANWKKALENTKKALNIFVMHFEEDDSFLGETYYDFGLIYQNQDKWSLALKNYQIALKKYQMDEDSWTQQAELHNNIGHIHCRLGDLNSAVESYEKSLEICKKHFGQENVKVALNYNNIGGLYYEKKEFEQASKFYDQALEILKKHQNDNSFYAAGVHFNRGNALTKLAKHELALSDYLKALKLKSKVKVKEDISLLDIIKAVGIAYSELGNCDQALKFHKKALKLAIGSPECSNNDVAALNCYIGRCYQEKQETEKALTYFQKASEILKNEQEGVVANSYSGQKYYRLGRLGGELIANLQVLTIETNDESENCKTADLLADTHKRAADLYSQHGQLEKSIEALESAKKIFSKGIGGNNLLIAEIYRSLGETYVLQGENKKGLEHQNVYLKIVGKV